jgi:hypothetical protein
MPAGDSVHRLLEQLSLSLKWVKESLQQQQHEQRGLDLAADTKGAVRQQLLQQLQALQQGVEQAQQRSSSSNSSQEQRLAGVDKAVLGDASWVQQLQEFAELLCANVLPQGPLWCNNPSCRCDENHAVSALLNQT